jgi:hypothetical protein
MTSNPWFYITSEQAGVLNTLGLKWIANAINRLSRRILPFWGFGFRAYDAVYTRLNVPVCPPNESVSTPSLCRIVTKSFDSGSSSTSVLLCHPASVSMPAPA